MKCCINITELAHGPAGSDHYRQVILVYRMCSGAYVYEHHHTHNVPWNCKIYANYMLVGKPTVQLCKCFQRLLLQHCTAVHAQSTYVVVFWYKHMYVPHIRTLNEHIHTLVYTTTHTHIHTHLFRIISTQTGSEMWQRVNIPFVGYTSGEVGSSQDAQTGRILVLNAQVLGRGITRRMNPVKNLSDGIWILKAVIPSPKVKSQMQGGTPNP
jgi:hypothetical protein